GADHVSRGTRRQRRSPTPLPTARLPRPRRATGVLRARPGRHRDGAETGDVTGAVDTRVSVGAVSLPNPVIAASATFGYGLEFAGLVAPAAVGAIAVKGLSLEPYPGKPAPRLVESPAGMLNAIGLQNVGIEAFLRERLPALVRLGARVVANFWGDSPEEF